MALYCLAILLLQRNSILFAFPNLIAFFYTNSGPENMQKKKSKCDKNWFKLRFEQLRQGNLGLKTNLKQI